MVGPFAPKIDSMQNIPVPDLGSGNQSAAGAIDKISTLLEGGSQIADSMVKKDISNQAQNIFEDANKPFVDAASVPSEIYNSQERMQRIQEAYQQGKLSETAYYARLVAGTKSLKSKYPGYSDEIDEVIRGVTGVRPANALRETILKQIEDEQSSAAANEKAWGSFLNDKQTQEALSLGRYLDVYTNPEKYSDPMTRNKVKAYVADYVGQRAKRDITLQELTVDDKTYQNNKRKVEDVVNVDLTTSVTNSIAGFGEYLDGKYGDNLYEIIAHGDKMSEQELQQLLTNINMQRNILYQNLRQRISTQTNGMVSGTDLKSQLDAAFQPYDDLIASITNKEFGIAAMSSRMNQMITENEQNKLLKNGKIRVFNALEKLSPKLSEAWLLSPDGARFVKDVSNVLPVIALDNMMYSDSDLPAELDSILTSTNNSKTKSKAVNNLISDVSTIMSDPKADPNAVKKTFERVYTNQDIFKPLDNQSQISVYKKLTNPEITKQVLASGDPQMIQKYYNWAKTMPKYLNDFRTMAQDVNTIQSTKNFMTAELGADGKIQVKVDESKYNDYFKTKGALSAMSMRRNMTNAKKYVDLMNDSLSTMVPIIKAAGEDPQIAVQEILEANAVDLDARSDGWMQWILENINQVAESNPATSGLVSLGQFVGGLMLDDHQKKISDALDIGEAGGDYNALLGFSNREGKQFSGTNVSDMTVDELIDFSAPSGDYGQYSKSVVGRVATPMGRYQIVGSTLRGLKQKLGLKGSEKFDQNLQDTMFETLLNEAGYQSYKSGQISKQAFIDRLSNVWEGFRNNSQARRELRKIL